MIVIPAVDIHEGLCVRGTRDALGREAVYASDPVAVARRWAAQGARWLHVIDLEGIAAGHPVQLDLVRAMAAVGVPVQVGGGFRTLEDVAQGLACGAARVLLDATALEAAAAAVPAFGDRVAALLSPTPIPRDELARAVDRPVAEVAAARDEARILANQAFAASAYGTHPYGRVPSRGAVARLSRAELIRFHRTHYRPAGATLVLAGDVDAAALHPRLARVFGEVRGAPPPVALRPRFGRQSPGRKGGRGGRDRGGYASPAHG